MGCLYALIFPDGKRYIGITQKSVGVRFKQHVAASSRMKTPVAIAINAVGADAVQCAVLAISNDAAYLKEIEVRAIEVYGTRYPNGYNATIGGDGVYGLASEIEIRRRQKLSKSRTSPDRRKKTLAIQREYWTEDRRLERARKIKDLWADPEYRSKILAARRKPVQQKLDLPKNKGDVIAKMKLRYWDQDEYRDAARKRRFEQLSLPTERALLSERQTKAMANSSLRHQIAHSMSKYRNAVFIKGAVPKLQKRDRGGVLQDTIPLLPNPFTSRDAIARGWQGREFDRAIERGWIMPVRHENF